MAQSQVAKEILRHRGNLFGFAFSLVRDFSLAEELFQEACARILDRQEQFVPGTNFSAWARAFVRAIAFEQQRWRSRILISEEAVAAAAAQFDGIEESYSSRREALRACIQKIGNSARQLVSLRFEQGLSLTQIAGRVRRSAGSVQVALSRTRAWLLRCIRQHTAQEAEA